MPRSPFALALRRCLSAAFVPALASGLAGIAASRWFAPPVAADAVAPAANTPWLQLPLFVTAVVCAFVAAAFWPVFAARRPGDAWIVRLQPGPLAGRGAVVGAALVAQFMLTAPVLLVLTPILGGPAAAAAQVAFEPGSDALLTEGAAVRFTVATPVPAVELHVRPLAGPPSGSLHATTLRVFADGDDVPLADPATLAVDQSGQLLRIAVASRPIGAIRIEAAAGNVPLFFPRGSVVAVGPPVHWTCTNAILAAVVWCVPTFVALAFACLCGVSAALPTVLGVTGVLLFVQSFGGVGPAGDALRELMRGRWLLTAGLFPSTLPFLAAGSTAMILAMSTSRFPRR
ncbi:MAG: hypothetical protein JNK78_15715 [Planctomycetes bacterium]|nr:hypothetical protein [Planctomycetota bacterium]